MDIDPSVALDNLYTNGILHFDADSYVYGRPPRYFAEGGMPYDQPLMANPYGYGPMMSRPLGCDAFTPVQSRHPEHFSFGAITDWLLIGAAGILGYKFKNNIIRFFKTGKLKEPPKPTVAKTLGKYAKRGGIFAACAAGLYAVYKMFGSSIGSKMQQLQKLRLSQHQENPASEDSAQSPDITSPQAPSELKTPGQ